MISDTSLPISQLFLNSSNRRVTHSNDPNDYTYAMLELLATDVSYTKNSPCVEILPKLSTLKFSTLNSNSKISTHFNSNLIVIIRVKNRPQNLDELIRTLEKYQESVPEKYLQFIICGNINAMPQTYTSEETSSQIVCFESEMIEHFSLLEDESDQDDIDNNGDQSPVMCIQTFGRAVKSETHTRTILIANSNSVASYFVSVMILFQELLRYLRVLSWVCWANV